jgi:GT2 family glycosyltransferase
MAEEKIPIGTKDTFSLLAVIVLHNLERAQSSAVRSFLEAASAMERSSEQIKVLLFDNTPSAGSPGALPENFQYESAGRNLGLAAAYNRALGLAEQENYTWLLTLDQDTTLPANFLAKMRDAMIRWQDDSSVAAIVPQLKRGATLLSPNYVHRLRNTAVMEGFTGLNEGEIYALNSGSVFRVSAIRELGGFCEDFWLDQLDLWLHHRFHRAGKRIYVAGNIQVEHNLSLQNYRTLSPNRLRNFLLAESAFFDIYKGTVENLALTARLCLRYAKRKAQGDNPQVALEILQMLKSRLFRSRRLRIEQWRSLVRERGAYSRMEEAQ